MIGPNGAGKTTCSTASPASNRPSAALRTHHRCATATPTGSARSLDRLGDPDRASRAGVARTFQNIRLFAGMTVLENLLVAQHNALMRASGYTLARPARPPALRAARAAADRARAVWLDRVGLVDRADDPAGALPYGAQRRLEIARAMCIEPGAALPRRARRRPQPARERAN